VSRPIKLISDDPPPHVVTICGSTRFRAEIADANRRLTLAGYIVLAPGVFAHDGDEMTNEQKAALDRLHLSKIDMSGWIHVVNPGGYIGESTRREIEYAQSIDKPVQFLVQPSAGIGGASCLTSN
jgi:dienelactone hydrolase